ncbi:MAG: DUF2934 domain-containing protein [Verrucomicrobiota bacterium]
MAKKTDTTPKTESVENPVKKTVAKKATASKTTTKRKSAAKKSAPEVSKEAKPESVSATLVSISSEEIALRAYYLGEKRAKLGLPGDSAHDWIEAERQLKVEAQAKN